MTDPAPTEFTAFANPDSGLHVGTAGWSYGGWVGNFYPPGTRPGDQLPRYAEQLSVVEIDATFHHWIAARTIAGWRDRTPDGFLFCPKMNRAITHDKALENCDEELAAFLAAMRLLGEKLGPIVIQFPGSFRPNRLPLLQDFLAKLPGDLRFAVEIRSPKWLDPDPGPYLSALRARGVAHVISDVPRMSPQALVTADFAYVRVIGDYQATERMYKEAGIEAHEEKFTHPLLDRRDELARWVELVRDLRVKGVDVFTFFNNHFAGHAPSTLKEFLAVWRAEIERLRIGDGLQ